MTAVFRAVERKEAPPGDWYFYRDSSYNGWQATGSSPHPLSPDHGAHLVAVDIDTGEILWRHAMKTRALSAALTTAGGLVVGADGDGYLNLHDVATGDVLFRTRLPGVVQGYPVTYAVDGKQYLAVAVGGGRVAGSANTLFVFAVPDLGQAR